jgi:protein-S-isoprenylcysteine O-methyltransferase Ste14
MRLSTLHALFLVLVAVSWVAFAAVFVFRPRGAPSSEKQRASGSILGVVLQGLSYAIACFGRPHLGASPSRHPALAVAVDVLMVCTAGASVALVAAAVRTLGRQWSFTARTIEGHELITSGPYMIVRHPIYTGMLGLLIATGLAVRHWIGLVIAIPVFVAGTVIRTRNEDTVLRESFGTQFDEYARRVPAFIPRLF